MNLDRSEITMWHVIGIVIVAVYFAIAGYLFFYGLKPAKNVPRGADNLSTLGRLGMSLFWPLLIVILGWGALAVRSQLKDG